MVFWKNPTFILVWNLIIQIFIFIFISLVLYKILPTRVYNKTETEDNSSFFGNVKGESNNWINKMHGKFQNKCTSVKDNLASKATNTLSFDPTKDKSPEKQSKETETETEKDTNESKSNWFANLSSFDPTKKS